VFVSSPPIVWSTSTPSFTSWSAATFRGSSPSFTRPRFTQSFTFVSFTRLLPIGLPPCCVSRSAFLRTASVTLIESPFRRPMYPLM